MSQMTELVTIKFFTTMETPGFPKSRELVYGCKFSASFLCTIPWFKAILNNGSLEAQRAIIEAEHPTFTKERCSQYMQHLNWRKNDCAGADPCLSCDCYVASLALYFDDEDFFCPIMKEGKITFTQEVPIIVRDDSPYYWENIAFTYHPKILPTLRLSMRPWNQEGRNRVFSEIKKHFDELKILIKSNLQIVTITPSSWSAIKDYLSMWNPVDKDAIRSFVEKKHIKWNQEHPDEPPHTWNNEMKWNYDECFYDHVIASREALFKMFMGFQQQGTLFEPKYTKDTNFHYELTSTKTEVDHWSIKDENYNSVVLVNHKAWTCSINLYCEGSLSIKERDNNDDTDILSFNLEQRQYTISEIRDDFPLYLPEDIAIELCENYPIIIASEQCSPYRRLARFASRHPPIGRHLWDDNKEALCELFHVPKKSHSRINGLDFDALFKYADSIAKTSSTDVPIEFKDLQLQKIEALIAAQIKSITYAAARRRYDVYDRKRFEEQRLRELDAKNGSEFPRSRNYRKNIGISRENKKMAREYKNEENQVLWDLQAQWWERYEVLYKSHKK